jgi:hypothetical protein
MESEKRSRYNNSELINERNCEVRSKWKQRTQERDDGIEKEAN